MRSFSSQWLRGWTGMALFAMLAVLTSPALAFACCCGQETAPVRVSQTPVSQTPVSSTQTAKASHPGCHGHDEPADSEAKRISVAHAAVAVAAASKAPCFKSLCECPHAADANLTFVAEQNASSFALQVLGATVEAFSPALDLPASRRFAFASNAAKPRSPATKRRSGRAPPAFSL